MEVSTRAIAVTALVGVIGLTVAVTVRSCREDATPQAVVGNCPAGTNNGIVQPNTPFRLYWCQPMDDALEGAYVTGLPAGKTQLDNVRIERGPFTDNLNQWSGAMPGQPRGNYTINVYAQNFGRTGDPSTVQDSQPSANFGLGVADLTIPVPAAPFRIRVDAGNVTRSTPPPVNRSPFQQP